MTGLTGLFAVTGAASGIGAAAARAIRAAGGDVALLDVDLAGAEREARAIGGTAHELDVAAAESIGTTFEQLGPLQGLVSCAGIAGPLAPVVACDPEAWARVTSINLDGTFLCLQAAARSMLRHGIAGAIVNTSSINGRFAQRGLAAYSAAKAGVTMLTRVAAAELAPAGIRVNAVAPGIVDTGMTHALTADHEVAARWRERNPFGRLGRPDDVADIIAFLLSDASRWLTGQTLVADGGSSLRVDPDMMPARSFTSEALVKRLAK